MKLVVLGRESLDELETWVGDLFAGVENKDLPQNRWDGVQPFTGKELLTQVFAKPVMDTRLLDIYFPFEDEEKLYETQPSRYISHLIGHEGPGSILAYIKAKGWANGLSSGAAPVCPGAAFFTVSIKLTEDGLKEYQEVVKAVFEYISLIKEKPPQKWIMDEVKGMMEVDFKFRQKSPATSFTSKLSSVMQKPLPREWLLSGTSLIRRFDSEGVTRALSYLRTDNFRLTLVSQNFPGDWDKKERWYGTEYRAQPIEKEFQAAVQEAGATTAKNRIPALHLPHKNEFIPTNLTVEKKQVTDPMKAPRLIRNDDAVRTWWKKDDRFWVPKGNVYISLRNLLARATPATTMKTDLYCELVKDALVEYSYDAEIAGLDYSLGSTPVGLDIAVGGYNDKMAVLLEKVLMSMRDLEVKPDRFKIIKDRAVRGLRNSEFQQPYRQVGDYTRWLNSDKGFITEQYLAELLPLKTDDISTFYPQLLQQVHIEVLAHGNIYKEDALRMTDLAESTLKPRKLPKSQWYIRRNLVLPPGSDFTYRRTLSDPGNVNHTIEYYLFVGNLADQALRARLNLLGQMTDELGFDQLRTKEQLGYIVFTGPKISSSTMGYRVIIQSERAPEYLEERINAFLALFGTKLESLSEQDFESHKRSLINKLLEKLKNLDQESQRFWSHITGEYFDFWQRENLVEHLKPLKKEDMIAFFNHHIDPASPNRAKLSVHMIAKSSPKAVSEDISPAEQREKVISLLSKYLTSSGLNADPSVLLKRFEAVDLPNGDIPAMLAAVAGYLENDLKAPSDIIEQILEQGQQLLGTVLPSLGIEVKTTDTEDLPKAPRMKDTTLVEDVYGYKASLPVSEGPRPVCDLAEFEETESKL